MGDLDAETFTSRQRQRTKTTMVVEYESLNLDNIGRVKKWFGSIYPVVSGIIITLSVP